MKESIEFLSLDDEEEETIQLGVESSDRETSYANCFIGTFCHFQCVEENGSWNFNSYLLVLHRLKKGEDHLSLGSFIGIFLEYYASAIQLAYKGIMRLRVRVDGMVKVIARLELFIRDRSMNFCRIIHYVHSLEELGRGG
ncbi:hypothetical protein Gohar_025195, partial [Gossypium harknessii]|nr:hypothetical protein [Gossypium harknessii]